MKMYIAGQFYKLRVNRDSDYGQFLANEENEEVLLPNRYVSEEIGVDDYVDVFVYHDSEDRLVATTEIPLAVVGEAAYLEVVDKTLHGAFMNWGLTKDLFVPVRNQITKMDIGEKYIAFLYVDNVTGRITATTRLNTFINNTEITVAPGDEVSILIALHNDLGYRVIINNKHWGMLYSNQIFQKVEIGEKYTAFVRRVTDDNRIDISLHRQGYGEVKDSADKLMDLIRKNEGTILVSDNSTPEEIYSVTNMSKKVFKRTAGFLMKKGVIEIKEDRLELKKKPNKLIEKKTE